MTVFQVDNSLYPDRYTREKRWVKVLPLPGRPIQTAELIELQSIQLDNIKQGFDAIYKNGSIVSGMEAEIVRRNDQFVEVSFTSGQFYIDGVVIAVDSQVIEVPISGEYVIGVEVTAEIITEEDDSTLRDPILNGALYGLPGAARLEWNTELLLDSVTSFTVAKVINGSLVRISTNPFRGFDTLTEQYIFERNGNFCVNGLNVNSFDSQEKNVTDRRNYANIESAIGVVESELLSLNNTVTTSANNLTSLEEERQLAIQNFAVNPTLNNQVVLGEIETRVNEATTTLANLTRLQVSKQQEFDRLETSLNEAEALLVSKVFFNISPGVAYIQGKRLDVVSPQIVTVPKDLETTTVESARFTFGGSAGTTLRTFSISAGNTYTDVFADFTELTFSFSNILYQENFYTIDVSVNVFGLSLFTTLGELLDHVVTEFNKLENEAQSSFVDFSSPSLILSDRELRTILKNNLYVQRLGISALFFTSTSLNEDVNQIGVTIIAYQRNDSLVIVNPSSILTVDVESANLSGAGQTNSFQLGFRPVEKVLNLVADIEQDLLPVVRGVAGTSDSLNEDSIVAITQVIQGNTTYIEGADYNLIDQSKIDWSLAGNEPASGTTYYVSFIYTQPLAKDIDYSLDKSTDSILFIGRTPAINRQFTVDYSYFLAKAGVITMDITGQVNYFLSSSSIDPIPPQAPPDNLALATFTLFANSVEIQDLNCQSVTFTELKSLAQQVKLNTKNLEKFSLDTRALQLAEQEIGDEPLGIYTDTYQDVIKLDLEDTEFSAAISPLNQAVTIDYTSTEVNLKWDSGGVFGVDRFNETLYIVIPYTEELLLEQDRSTEAKLVKSFNDPTYVKRGLMEITNQINFFNKDIGNFTSCDYFSKLTSLFQRTNSNRPIFLENISTNVINDFSSAAEQIIEGFINGTSVNFLDSNLDEFLNLLVSTPRINSSKQVSIHVRDFNPDADGLEVFFSGRKVDPSNYTLSAGNPTSLIYPNTFKASSNGLVDLDLDLPEVTCGTHSIEIIGIDSYASTRVTIYNTLLNHTVLTGVNNWEAVPLEIKAIDMLPFQYDEPIPQSFRFTTIASDLPLALPVLDNNNLNKIRYQFPSLNNNLSQTFVSPLDAFITKFSFKLKEISATQDLRIELKSSQRENPNNTLYGIAETNLYQPDSNAILWTDFELEYPILIRSNNRYTMGLTALGDGYEIFSAKRGENDINTSTIVGNQFFLDGNLFSSENGILQQSLIDEDLTYRVYRAEFTINTDEVIDLGSYGTVDGFVNINAFTLNTRDVVPIDTTILYEYSLDDINWTPFEPNILVCLDENQDVIWLRATLNTSNSNVSPILYSQGSTVTLYRNVNVPLSTVVSKVVEYPEEYSNVTIYVKVIQGGPANLAVYFNDTPDKDAAAWVPLVLDTTYVNLIDPGTGYQEYRYRYNLGSGLGPSFSYKVEFLSVNLDSPPVIKDVVTYVF